MIFYKTMKKNFFPTYSVGTREKCVSILSVAISVELPIYICGRVCQVIIRKTRIHARRAIRRRLRNPQSGNVGIKKKEENFASEASENFFTDFSLNIFMELYYFQIVLTFISQNSDLQTPNYTPHHNKNMPITLSQRSIGVMIPNYK